MLKKILLITTLLFSITIFSDVIDNKDNIPKLKEFKKLNSCKLSEKVKGSFEAGLKVGYPFGGTFKFYFTESLAAEILGGVNYEKDPIFMLDPLIFHYKFYKNSSLSLKAFVGIGMMSGYGIDSEEFLFALRLPIGIALPLKNSPVEFYLSTTPAMAISPEKEFDFQWGVGMRYNFGKTKKSKKYQQCLANNVGIQGDNIGGLKGDYDSLRASFGDTIDRLNEMSGDLDKTKGALTKTKGDLNKTKDQLDGTQKALTEVSNTLTATKEELKETQEKLTQVEQDKEEAEKAIEEQKKQLEEKDKKLKESNDKLTKISNEKSKLEDEIKNSTDPEKVKQLEAQLAKLKEEKEEMEESIVVQSKDRCENSGGTYKNGKCVCSGGRVSKNNTCVCGGHKEMWSSKNKKCICQKGFYRDKNKNKCVPCTYLKSSGYCRWDACSSSEKKVWVDKRDGKNVYTCKSRCTLSNETWSSKKKKCICKEGYKRVGNECKARY